MDDAGEGRTALRLLVRHPIPKELHDDVLSYSSAYIRKCGWRVKKMKLIRRYLEIVVDNV